MKNIWNKSYKKVFLSIALVATSVVTVSSFLWTLLSNENNSLLNLSAQERVQSYKNHHAITGVYDFEDELSLAKEIGNLEIYVGQDIAKIIPKKVFSSNKSSYSFIERPYTGIYVQNPPSGMQYQKMLEKNENGITTNQTIIANAYDYVNLQWVHVSAVDDEFVIEPIFSAPPPGLFADNQWPVLKPTGNKLNELFPTKSIADTIALALRLPSDTTFTEDEWYEKSNVLGLELNLSNLNLNDVSELFNPNLIWGFGLLQLLEVKDGKEVLVNNGKREILYKGLTSLNVSNNALRHLPNANYDNMPALRAIDAGFNQIEAVGDFATYASEFSPLLNQKAEEENSYYWYLQKLLKGKHKDRKEVVEIKEYLEALAQRQNNRFNNEFYNLGFNNQFHFAYYVSRNPAPPPNVKSGRSDYYDYGHKLLNVYQVFFNVNKALYKLALNNNQIEQLPAFKFRITILNVANNKLKYVPPIKFQPLPINYLTSRHGYNNSTFSIAGNWWNPDSLEPQGPISRFSGTDGVENSYGTTALPEYSFLGNQLLDFWPNQNLDFVTSNLATSGERSDRYQGHFRSDWITWPNKSTWGETNGRLTDETTLKTMWPFHRVVSTGVDYPYETNQRSYYTTRNWYTYGVIGQQRPWLFQPEWWELAEKKAEIYNAAQSSAATLLGGLNPQNVSFTACDPDPNAPNPRAILYPHMEIRINGLEGCWVQAALDLYGYKFAQKNDLISSIGVQDFNGMIFYKKDKPFLLPNFYTDKFKAINARNFSEEDAQKSYYSMAPYLFGRAIPQNFSFVLNGFNNKHISLSFKDQFGQELAPQDGTNYTWEELVKAGLGTSKTPYWTNSAKQLNKPTSELYYYNTWTGYIPYNPDALDPNVPIFDDAQVDVQTNSPGNNPVGVALEKFSDNSRFFDLTIKQTDLNINYSWRINIVDETDQPTAKLKNGGILNLTDSPVLKRAFLQEASNPNFLIANLAEWLDADVYVTDYIQKNPSSIKIEDINAAQNTITVRFNVLNWNGQKLNINDMTLKGFNKLEIGVYDEDNDKVLTTPNEIKDFLITKAGFVEDVDTNKKWIQQYFVTNVPGLDLEVNNKTTNKTVSWWKIYTDRSFNNLAREKGFYKFSELDDQYIIDILGTPGSANLNFTLNLQVQKSVNNFAVLDVQTFNFDFFKQLIIGFDATQIDKNLPIQSLKTAFDQKDFALLQKAVTFQTAKLQTNNIPEMSATENLWIDGVTINDLITQKKLPTKTNITFDDFSYSILNGNFSFNLIFQNLTNPSSPINLTTLPVFVENLNLQSTEFSWKTGTELPLAGVNFLNANQIGFTNQTTKAIYDELKQKFMMGVNSAPTLVNNSTFLKKDFSEFNGLMGRILQYQETNVQGFRDNTFNTKKDFQDAWKEQIAITFNPERAITFETVNALTEEDFINNITYNDALLSINFKNVVITGGMNYGYFYTLWENSAQFAPTISLPENNIIFTAPVTTLVPFSLKPSNNVEFFEPAITAWKQLLPSQWLQKLVEAQINSVADLEQNYSADNIETAIGFLNHLLYANTSTSIYQTRTIIENISNIQINDLTGEVRIPANTLKTLYYYNNNGTVTNTLVDYDQEIKFLIKGLFDDNNGPVFWKKNDVVNLAFSNMSVANAKQTLNTMFTSATEFYQNNNSTTTSDSLANIAALTNFFISDNYRNNNYLNKYFTNPFTVTDANTNVGNYTKFTKIEYLDENAFEGKITVKVTAANYVTGYDKANMKFEFATGEQLVQSFELTNLERPLFSPVWKTPQKEMGALNIDKMPNVLVRTDWKNIKVEEFLENLKNQNAQDGYFELYNDNNSLIGNLIEWARVDLFGKIIKDDSNDSLSESEQISASNIFKKTKVRVKVEDLSITANKTIIIKNVVVHIEDPNNQNFVNSFYNPNNQTLDANYDIKLFLVQELILDGFKNQPAEVVVNSETIGTLKLSNGDVLNLNSILPSELFIMILNNLNNPSFIHDFLTNYLLLTGSQTEDYPLTLGFSDQMIDALTNNTNIQEHLVYNNGLGQFFINTNSIVVNNPFMQNKQLQHIGPLPLAQFLATNHQQQVQTHSFTRTKKLHSINNDLLAIQNLKLENTKIFTPNPNVPTINLASDIRQAIEQLSSNNYAILYKILSMNDVLTNNDEDKTSLKITGLVSDYENGRIKVEYAIDNYYDNGVLYKNHHSSFNLNWNFTSPIRLFLMVGLPIILTTLMAIIFLSTFLHYKNYIKKNTKILSRKKDLPFKR